MSMRIHQQCNVNAYTSAVYCQCVYISSVMSMRIHQQCDVKRGSTESCASTNTTTDYLPSYKARQLCRTGVMKEVGEKHVKASTVKVKFTSEEDCFLKKGIEKYGKGAWSRILRDPQLHFNANRSSDTLRMRAASSAFRIFMNCN